MLSMKPYRILLLLAFLLAGCNPSVPAVTTPSVAPTSVLPTARVEMTRPPDPKLAVTDFLKAWQAEDYAGMYAMVTKLSQDAITEKDFSARYTDTANNLTLSKLDYEILSALTNPTNAQVAYKVTFHTSLLGDLSRQMTMNLALETGQWHVQWEDGLIMPELKGGNRLALDKKVPARGNIYDREGHALAAQAEVIALWVNTGELIPDQEGTLLSELSGLTGRTPEYIKSLYQNAVDIGANWRVSIGEASADDVNKRMGVLSELGGLHMEQYRDRYYVDGGVAPHVVGYESAIYPEELQDYLRKGYRGDERVGRAGLELSEEEALSGQHGASLHVVDSKGSIVTLLGEVEAKPAESVYTTMEKDLQAETQKAIQGFNAGAVVIERDTGRILAMASSPGFDPNRMMPGAGTTNQNFDPNNAGDFFNRASSGTYPLGSVFKIITMAAGLESGDFTADSTYDCQHEFTELPGDPLYDWTYEKGLPPSGKLTLPEGLMRSCNPWFYHIGLDLFRVHGDQYLANMARAFGLGSPTGIQGVSEEAGNIANPGSDDEAVRMAIGQFTVLVTPLQVADFVAAVGNNGTLYKPQVIEKIAPLDGPPTFQFKPEVSGKLPVSEANLKIIQDAMRSVIANTKGTAHYTFAGMSVPIYGKTGTAQSNQEDPHAWFAAYTDAKREDKPDIAVAVVAEYAGEGSEIAAPIVRRIMEVYFEGAPRRLYPWEASYNVTRTPTPLYTDTPEPTNTPEPDATSSGQ